MPNAEPPVTRTDGETRSHGLYGMRTRAVICSRSSRTKRDNRRICGLVRNGRPIQSRRSQDGRLTEQPWTGLRRSNMTDNNHAITEELAVVAPIGTKGTEEHELPSSLRNNMELCLQILREFNELIPSC